ncbi:hypothetical protein GCM10010106_47670 [Thermopolyspora flexuosa]|uniref:Putative ABC transport system permease protein n=1 Tax=Thermopolyspora flexuosa TaxID=103836 RepID=A0A543ITU1_9ACTN|nr:FtsX-like permease family protein [Thermopolyspora flexuosa]TQM73993.1 putative ABC transport system permease protein [Thermopolyspora flexuosa]GGM93698.1 hypothetical protein GCM10010106_47670 [Thermopolyspora flexuosa]
MSALRAALRLAWRGIRREKGRSALIVVLIGLPVLAVTAFFTLYATYELDAREALPGRLGSADALIWAVGDVAVQSPDGSGWSSSGRGGPPPDEDAARALLRPGSRLLPYHRRTVAYPVEQGRIFLDVVELDLRDPLTRGMARLRQGRLPAAPGEVVVSAAMASEGVGVGDALPYLGEQERARVVGVLARSPEFHSYAVVGLPGSLLKVEPGERHWLVDHGGHPVTWENVQRLNRAGFHVVSRAVVENPPPGQPVDVRPESVVQGVLVTTMIVLEVVLVAGPAFAVGLRRRRRWLAQIAAQGGSPRQLRLVVLADGLLLGVGAALLGLAGGVGVVAAGIALVRALDVERYDLPIVAQLSGAGPFDVPWTFVVPVAVLGAASGVIAAVLPARQAARQDVAAVLAGRETAFAEGAAPYRSRRVTPGALLVAAGVVATVLAIRRDSLVWIAAAALLTQFGLIALTPWLVAAAGRLAGRLPLPLRLSVRDAARHRTRTACAVAAVMTAATAMSATAITLTSKDAMLRDGYTAAVPVGTTLIDGERVPEQSWPEVVAAVGRVLPGVRPVEVHRAREAEGRRVRLAVTGAECEIRCGEHAPGPGSGDLPIGDERLLRLVQGRSDPAAAAAFAAGKAVAFDRGLVRDGTLTLDVLDGRSRKRRSVAVPAVVATAADPRHAVAVLPEAAVRAAGLTLEVRRLLVDPAERRLDTVAEARLEQELKTVHDAAFVHVERGHRRDMRPVLQVLTAAAAVVILGATFAVTGLAAADLRPDLATMAAVGAAPRLRRLVVAGQALVISGLGAAVGLAAGLLAGAAAVWSLAAGPQGAQVRYRVEDGFLTAVPPHTPLLEVPWPYLAAVVAGLPLLAALVAGAFTRTRFTLTRRLT